jgi:hypothetical protein
MCCPALGRQGMGQKNKIKEMDKLLNFRDDPTTKIKTAISFLYVSPNRLKLVGLES